METSVNKQALIIWYYQCKKYTPVRISILTKTDIGEVKRILRKDCFEYEMEERRKESATKLLRKQNNYSCFYAGGLL